MDELNFNLLIWRVNKKMWYLEMDEIEAFIDAFDHLFYHHTYNLTVSRVNAEKLWSIKSSEVDSSSVWELLDELTGKRLMNKKIVKFIKNSFYDEKKKKPLPWEKANAEPRYKKIKFTKEQLQNHQPFIEKIKYTIDTLIKFDAYSLYLDIFTKKRPETTLRTISKTSLLLDSMRNNEYYEPLFGEFWRKSENLIVTVDQDIVEDHLTILENGAFFVKLAELISRMDESVKNVEDYIVYERHVKKNLINVKKIPENTTGMTFGDNIQIALPHQLAMRHNKLMKKVFGLSLLEKRLMILEQEGKAVIPEVKTIPVIKFRNLQKGPIIIILDTSKSMKGMPESVAKAIAISVMNITLGENRKCFVIGYNDKNKGFDATPLGDGFISLQKMFVNDFSDVTSVEKTLELSVDKLTESDYRNSDVLLISDKLVMDLPEVLKARIIKSKDELIRYHSILVDIDDKVEIENDYHMTDVWDNVWRYIGTKENCDEILKRIEDSFYNTVEKNLQQQHEIRTNKIIEEKREPMRAKVIGITPRKVD